MNRYTLTSYIPITLMNVSQLTNSDRSTDLPCSIWSALVVTLIVPGALAGILLRLVACLSIDLSLSRHSLSIFIPTLVVRFNDRAWLLLFRFEITSDLTRLASTDASSPLPQLSWYSRNNHMYKWKWILPRIYIPILTCGLSILIAATLSNGIYSSSIPFSHCLK
jgi:hypothetical protein